MKNSPCCCLVLGIVCVLFAPALAWADGKLFKPRNYQGSLEESSQEAIIIFHAADTMGDAVEDLILKIGVVGETDPFAWVVSFQNEPQVKKEDAALFRELFNYVEARSQSGQKAAESKDKGAKDRSKDDTPRPVDVLSRQVVGSYDVAVVRENVPGAL